MVFRHGHDQHTILIYAQFDSKASSCLIQLHSNETFFVKLR